MILYTTIYGEGLREAIADKAWTCSEHLLPLTDNPAMKSVAMADASPNTVVLKLKIL